VGELETEYGEQMDFRIIPAAETALAAEELESFGFTALRHGLVTFSAAGEPVGKLPGHEFGREEIVAAIEAALATN
jgi:hypothetical protein